MDIFLYECHQLVILKIVELYETVEGKDPYRFDCIEEIDWNSEIITLSAKNLSFFGKSLVLGSSRITFQTGKYEHSENWFYKFVVHSWNLITCYAKQWAECFVIHKLRCTIELFLPVLLSTSILTFSNIFFESFTQCILYFSNRPLLQEKAHTEKYVDDIYSLYSWIRRKARKKNWYQLCYTIEPKTTISENP